MTDSITKKNLRILVVDDNRAIHDDFRKILCQAEAAAGALEDVESVLFDTPASPSRRIAFEVDSAYQGNEGLALVEQAVKSGNPYAMAFVDVRMPPGWDGVETTSRLWAVCPDLQIVICTAYSDYSWDEMAAKLNSSDQLVILKKPFDSVEVLQLANALTEKWRLHQQVRLKVDQLEKLVQERTQVLRETNVTLQAEVVERQRAAEALRESEERYQLLFSKNPLPMWVFDAQSLAFLAVNETAVREYGYSVAEFLSMGLRDIHAPEAAPAVLRQLAAADGARASSFLTRHRKQDGTVIDVEIISRAFLFDGREAKLILANNITERKAAEDRIHEQATLLNLAHDAIYVRDLAGRIQFWNKGAERLYGWTCAEAVGSATEKIFPLDLTGVSQAAEKTLLAKGEWSGELRKHTRQGQEVVVDSRWTLLRNDAGIPRSVLVINADVTEKRKLEAQFLRSQRMEGIGTLATGMAHDLNNVLAPILMSAGAMRWELAPEEREMAISRIEMSVKRGAEIIQQVLTFGRGVSGERVAVDPGDVIQEVSKIIGQTFPKDIAITTDVKTALWPIIGDKTQIHQILLNLCINARDAMSKGGALSLLAQNFMVDEPFAAQHAPIQAGPYVLLQVGDTGEGIPHANLEKIFDPFFTTKEFGKGTGLGLSTVLGIVKSHRGLVTVDSKVGKGTTFKVLLPASPAVVKRTNLSNGGPLPRGRGEAILLVDDEVNIVAATRTMLEQYGYKVLVANHGHDALALFQANDPVVDLVVTDIMMPGMDGIALIQALRRVNPVVKVIASSGLGKDLAGGLRAAELKSLGVKSFLPKPYTAEKLLKASREALDESEALTPGKPVPADAVLAQAGKEAHG